MSGKGTDEGLAAGKGGGRGGAGRREGAGRTTRPRLDSTRVKTTRSKPRPPSVLNSNKDRGTHSNDNGHDGHDDGRDGGDDRVDAGADGGHDRALCVGRCQSPCMSAWVGGGEKGEGKAGSFVGRAGRTMVAEADAVVDAVVDV